MKKLFLIILLSLSQVTFASLPLHYLQKFDLSDLTLIETKLKGKNAPRITIMDPDGYIHNTFPGGYIGKNFGKILIIEKDRVKLREIIQNKDEEWEKRFIWVELKTEYPKINRPINEISP